MSKPITPGMDTSLWENIQNKIIDYIRLKIDGNLIEVISEPNKYIVHYQDYKSELCEYIMNKKLFWWNCIPSDITIELIKEMRKFFTWDEAKLDFVLELDGIDVECNGVRHFITYKDIETRFVKILDINHKLKLKLVVEEEEKIMNPFTVAVSQKDYIGAMYTTDRSCCDSAIACNQPLVYEHKKLNTKYQNLLKDKLGIDTKFNNRFYKIVSNSEITICNYENNEMVVFSSYIDGVERKYITNSKNDEEEMIYDYVVSNSSEFTHWVNSLKTFNYEDYIKVNKVVNKYNLRDVVYYVKEEFDIDSRIFNELWDLMTSQQKQEYLENEAKKKNLVHKGSIIGLHCLIDKYDNNVTYDVFDFNFKSIRTVCECKIFDNEDDAIKYLVEDSVNRNKKD